MKVLFFIIVAVGLLSSCTSTMWTLAAEGFTIEPTRFSDIDVG
jgi:hypothetical protein